MRHNQMEYFYGDVLLRGKYPNYAFHFFEERGIAVHFGPEDEADLANPADFMSFSYYYTTLCDAAHYAKDNSTFRNPSLAANP